MSSVVDGPTRGNGATSTRRILPIDQFKEAARGRWLEVLLALCIALRPAIERIGQHVACPVHGGENGDAFRLFPDANETGGGGCNTCGMKANGVSLLSWVLGIPPVSVARKGLAYLGLDDRASQSSRTGPKTPETLWAEAIEGHERIERYIVQGRGLSGPVPKSLRFHPEVWYPVTRTLSPCMLAPIYDIARVLKGLHCTWLAVKGNGKAGKDAKRVTPSPKGPNGEKITGHYRGSHIHVYDYIPGHTLAITEGIEDAIAIHQAVGCPVWAASSSSLMPSMVLPDDVGEILICADADEAGEKAFVLANRLVREGRSVRVIAPTTN